MVLAKVLNFSNDAADLALRVTRAIGRVVRWAATRQARAELTLEQLVHGTPAELALQDVARELATIPAPQCTWRSYRAAHCIVCHGPRHDIAICDRCDVGNSMKQVEA
jgi:hypothetical protein